MNNNKINNSKVDVPNGIKLNDKDYMNSLLSCLKEMVKNYSIALTEASNETLYSKYKEMFDTYINLQREVFETMFRYGWYSLEKLDNNRINEKYQMLSEEKISLG